MLKLVRLGLLEQTPLKGAVWLIRVNSTPIAAVKLIGVNRAKIGAVRLIRVNTAQRSSLAY